MSLSVQAVSDIVKEMVVEYASVTSQALTNTILNLQADLDIKLQTSVLPRPALLGQHSIHLISVASQSCLILPYWYRCLVRAILPLNLLISAHQFLIRPCISQL